MARRNQDNATVIDMTPFSDMTFQLMIFFIVANDMSQKELENLKLPAATVAIADKPDPDRPILNILEDGTVRFKGRRFYWPGIDPEGHPDPNRPGRPDYYFRVAEVLATQVVTKMEKVVDPEHPELGALPDQPLLIRADRNTPFKYVQKLMEVCSRKGIQIWKVQLAVSENNAAEQLSASFGNG